MFASRQEKTLMASFLTKINMCVIGIAYEVEITLYIFIFILFFLSFLFLFLFIFLTFQLLILAYLLFLPFHFYINLKFNYFHKCMFKKLTFTFIWIDQIFSFLH